MSTGQAVAARIFDEHDCPVSNLTTRKMVAIGDLHGDFYRLVRLLEEEQILIAGTFAWNPRAFNVDLVLIGDYVDWRGEPLEGDPDRAAEGSRRILELIYSLHQQLKDLRACFDDFDSNLYALRGNHDEMMLEALRILDFMSCEDVDNIMKNSHHYLMLRKTVMGLGLAPDQVEIVMKFLNWYVQGGKTTLEGWGTLAEWKRCMDGGLGEWLRNELLLGVVVNRKMFCHTAPDLPEFWRPMRELLDVAPLDKPRLVESFLWSRKLWGFDYYTGTRTHPFTQDELESMLSGMGVDAIVVGHTPVTSLQEPFVAYDGKVINIDLHGIPGSQALIEVYNVEEAALREGIRAHLAGRHVDEQLDKLSGLLVPEDDVAPAPQPTETASELAGADPS
jgi:hypothetical protein